MTAAEAITMPNVVAAIAALAKVDKRTVVACLKGESPRSSVWGKVKLAAQSSGITGLPEPATRKQPQRKPCPECERLRVENATLKRALEATSPRKLAVVPPAPPVTPEHATG